MQQISLIFSIYQLLLCAFVIDEALPTLVVDECRSTTIHAWAANAALVRYKTLLRLTRLPFLCILCRATAALCR